MTQSSPQTKTAGAAQAPRPNVDLKSAVAEASALFAAANPQSQAKHLEAAGSMPGGNTRTVLFFGPFPLYFTRGEGTRLHDLDGHTYVDFLGEYTAGIYGHSHPVIAEAVTAALAQGIAMGGHTRHEVALAAALRARFPSVDLMRFCNSGTEANLMALSAARLHTGREGVLAFAGSYHGSLFGFPFKPPAKSINIPFPSVIAPYNDLAATRKLIDENAGRLAAVIVEPMMGGGGCIAATRDFLAGLRAACDKHKIVLIFDEVMTSRLSPGGLQKVHGITPDLTSFGKYIGGGLPTGAFGGRVEIMGMFDPRRPDAVAHAGTFNNNVLTMAAGVAGLTKVYTADEAVRLNKAGDALRERLSAMCKKRGVKVVVTGIGSMMTVHPGITGPVNSPADVAAVPQGLRDLFHYDMLARGIHVARRGMINLSVPMVQDDFDRLAAAFDEFLSVRAGLLT
ncbi:MAG: aminotransferase class III-fold pyridoxal phosphate-dependent enzyme [Alphaproteobacteria bacterium]|nr:aminotransferase class III-fold pyridoxal phosphate-dependent enzyme [Alphaproteobacteria bacterium]